MTSFDLASFSVRGAQFGTPTEYEDGLLTIVQRL